MKNSQGGGVVKMAYKYDLYLFHQFPHSAQPLKLICSPKIFTKAAAAVLQLSCIPQLKLSSYKGKLTGSLY